MVDAEKTARRAEHGVICGRETEDDFVPGCGAGEEDLDDYSEEVHVAEGARPESDDG